MRARGATPVAISIFVLRFNNSPPHQQMTHHPAFRFWATWQLLGFRPF